MVKINYNSIKNKNIFAQLVRFVHTDMMIRYGLGRMFGYMRDKFLQSRFHYLVICCIIEPVIKGDWLGRDFLLRISVTIQWKRIKIFGREQMNKWFTVDEINEDTYIISEYRH